MGSYVVSARKYRPETFDTVVGQGHITETLVNEITTDRLAQAFLFCGPRGVGKTTCARILAKEINKNSVPEGYDYSFNIFELDAASNNSVDDIRALTEQVRIPPQTGDYKVYIIDEVHMLSSAAFNAFLKTLEEPPKYAIFILATTEKHKILPTILSRCQVFNFDRIQIPEIIEYLKGIAADQSLEVEEEALHIIAQKADGAMRDALSIFDQMASFGTEGKITYQEVIDNLNILDYDYYFKVVDFFSEGDISNVLVLFDEIQRNGFDGQLFINGLANHFRDLLVAQNASSQQLLEKSKEIAGKYHKQAQAVSASFIINAINILGETDVNYKASRNQRLHVELCLIKLASLQHAIDVTKKKKPRLAKLIESGYYAYLFAETGDSETKTGGTSTTTVKKSRGEDDAPAATVKIGGLRSAMQRKASNEKTEVKDTTEPEEKQQSLTTLTIEMSTKLLKDYSEQLEMEKRGSLAAFFADPIVALEGDQISITVGSKMVENEIMAEQHKLISYFAGQGYKLGGIHCIVNARAVSEYKIFTPKQQFEAMVKEIPILEDFANRFNLEFE